MRGKQNILLITIDQLRADVLHGTLARAAQMPNLHALARRSAMFMNHFSVTAPCGPSRASLLTGQYARNHRSVRNGTPLRHDTPTLPLEARALGYTPLLFGYTDTTQDPRALPPDDPRLTTYEEAMAGFDEVVRMRQETDDRVWRDYLSGRGIRVPEGDALYRPSGDRPDDPAIYPEDASDTAFLTDRFLDRMAVEPSGWFAHLSYIRPHPPFVAPEPWNRLIDRSLIPAPRRDEIDHPFLTASRQAASISSNVVGFPDLEPTDETIIALRAVYLGLAAEVDHHIGRVIDWLDERGQTDETFLVVTSDHGELLGDFGLWGKVTFHDAAFHVPLLIRDPHQPGSHGTRFEQPTESVDVTPTIIAAAGGRVPHSMDGTPLTPLLEGGAWPKTATISELDFGNPIHPPPRQRAMGLSADEANLMVYRRGPWRQVEFAADLPPLLFDSEGRGEACSLASDAERSGLLADLGREMLRHRLLNQDGTFARTLIVDGRVQTRAE